MTGTAHAQDQTVTATPWPEGVSARYLTTVGATVDITTPYTERQVGGHAAAPTGGGFSYQAPAKTVIDVTITARCSGCLDVDTSTHPGLFPTALEGLVDSGYGRAARRWAQSHAETCRALPRPAG